MKKKLKIGVLEQKAAIHMLIALLERGRMTTMDMVMSLPFSQSAIYTAKSQLTEAGLIVEEEQQEFPRAKIHRLTEKGRLVAQKLLEIEKILEGGGEGGQNQKV